MAAKHVRYWSSSDWDYKKKKEFQLQLLVTKQRFYETTTPIKRIDTSNFHQYVIDINQYYQQQNRQPISSHKQSRSTKSLKNLFSSQSNLQLKFKQQGFFPEIN